MSFAFPSIFSKYITNINLCLFTLYTNISKPSINKSVFFLLAFDRRLMIFNLNHLHYLNNLNLLINISNTYSGDCMNNAFISKSHH